MILEVMGTPYQDYVFRDDDYVVQQYTGLKDKTGKEIWEGDLVKDERECVYEVEMSEGMYWALYYYDVYVGNDCEVIGNKFENPELLTT